MKKIKWYKDESEKRWNIINPLYCPLCDAPLCTTYSIPCRQMCIHNINEDELWPKDKCLQYGSRSQGCHCDPYSVIKALVQKYRLEEVPATLMHPNWFQISTELQVVSIMEYLTNNQAPDVMKILDDSLFTI